MKKLDNKKRLSHLMNKALTQVGAFFVKHKTVRFAQESQSVLKQERLEYQYRRNRGQHDRNELITNKQEGNMLQIITLNHCPVNLQCHPLKVLLHLVCRAFFVRDDLNLKSNMKTFIGIRLKITSGILHQINNSEEWYQNVLFSGNVPKPCYKVKVIIIQ